MAPPPHRVDELGIDRAVDTICGTAVTASADGNVWLMAYPLCWVVCAASLP